MSDLLQNYMSTSHTIRVHEQKFEINLTKIKGGCQSGRKAVTHNSKSDLPLIKCKKSLRYIKQRKVVTHNSKSDLPLVVIATS